MERKGKDKKKRKYKGKRKGKGKSVVWRVKGNKVIIRFDTKIGIVIETNERIGKHLGVITRKC